MWAIKCSQRGCVSTSDAQRAPARCPVCRNPLVKGDAAQGASSEPQSGASALEQSEGGATVNTDDTGPSESDPS
jgi:hypothetical protein